MNLNPSQMKTKVKMKIKMKSINALYPSRDRNKELKILNLLEEFFMNLLILNIKKKFFILRI